MRVRWMPGGSKRSVAKLPADEARVCLSSTPVKDSYECGASDNEMYRPSPCGAAPGAWSSPDLVDRSIQVIADAMPMSTKLSAGRVGPTYAFIKANRDTYTVQAICRILGVAPSGYYEWLTHPISDRAHEDARVASPDSRVVHGQSGHLWSPSRLPGSARSRRNLQQGIASHD